jgi:2-acylglycerol O-acyltransferase 2
MNCHTYNQTGFVRCRCAKGLLCKLLFEIVCRSLAYVICLTTSFYLIRSDGWPLYLFLLYVGWMLIGQTFHETGGHRQMWFRRLTLWRHFCNYFPIKLVKTAELCPSQAYLFGYHPHGIIGIGAFGAFATEGCGFGALFPRINLRLLTLRMNFRIPFMGFYLTMLGVCDASKTSCYNILKQGPGNALMLVLGGAKESLDAHPGTANLTLATRKGFVKIALETGAHLVPVFGFGENELFEQTEISWLRELQNKMQAKMGFAIPFFHGRGVFTYNWGILPWRRPLTVVVGAPIEVPKVLLTII